MILAILLTSYVISIGLIIYFMVMGPSHAQKKDLVGNVYLFLVNTFFPKCLYIRVLRRHGTLIFSSICGNSCLSILMRVKTRVFDRKHPIVQIFYLSILFSGCFIFSTQGWPLLNRNNDANWINKYELYIYMRNENA